MDPSPRHAPEPRRRDVVLVAALAFVGAGSAVALWPFIAHMNPDAGVAAPKSVDVGLAAIPPDSALRVNWNGLPVFVRHRTREEIDRSRARAVAGLSDPFARRPGRAGHELAHDAHLVLPDWPQWSAVVGVCPHTNCVLVSLRPEDRRQPDDAYFCPCCAARFDGVGRVHYGPSRRNLMVPPFAVEGGQVLRLGARRGWWS